MDARAEVEQLLTEHNAVTTNRSGGKWKWKIPGFGMFISPPMGHKTRSKHTDETADWIHCRSRLRNVLKVKPANTQMKDALSGIGLKSTTQRRIDNFIDTIGRYAPSPCSRGIPPTPANRAAALVTIGGIAEQMATDILRPPEPPPPKPTPAAIAEALETWSRPAEKHPRIVHHRDQPPGKVYTKEEIAAIARSGKLAEPPKPTWTPPFELPRYDPHANVAVTKPAEKENEKEMEMLSLEQGVTVTRIRDFKADLEKRIAQRCQEIAAAEALIERTKTERAGLEAQLAQANEALAAHDMAITESEKLKPLLASWAVPAPIPAPAAPAAPAAREQRSQPENLPPRQFLEVCSPLLSGGKLFDAHDLRAYLAEKGFAVTTPQCYSAITQAYGKKVIERVPGRLGKYRRMAEIATTHTRTNTQPTNGITITTANV